MTGGRWTEVRHAEGCHLAKLGGGHSAQPQPPGRCRGTDTSNREPQGGGLGDRGVLDDDEVKAQQQLGERPRFQDMIQAFWAKGNEHFSGQGAHDLGPPHAPRYPWHQAHPPHGATCQSPWRRTTGERTHRRAPQPSARRTGTRPRRDDFFLLFGPPLYNQAFTLPGTVQRLLSSL